MDHRNLHVYARVRPSSSSRDATPPIPQLTTTPTTIATDDSTPFTFDRVYAGDPQALVYDEVGSGIVKDVMDAVNVCVICYGPEGSGKRHTFLGGREESDRGLVPRVAHDLFTSVRDANALEFHMKVANTLTVSAYYVLNEKCYDALKPSKSSSFGSSCFSVGRPKLKDTSELRVRESPSTGPFVEGLSETMVTSMYDIETFYTQCEEKRPSPSAHFVFMIRYAMSVQQPVEDTEESPANGLGESTRRLDMSVRNASGERPQAVMTDDISLFPPVRKRSHTPRRSNSRDRKNSFTSVGLLPSVVKRSKEKPAPLNMVVSRRSSCLTFCSVGVQTSSLSALSRIVQLLDNAKVKKGVIPFRDTALTWLLKDSLSGNSKTHLFATVTAHATEEGVATLVFAEHTRNIRTIYSHNTINENPAVANLRRLMDAYFASPVSSNREAIHDVLIRFPAKGFVFAGMMHHLGIFRVARLQQMCPDVFAPIRDGSFALAPVASGDHQKERHFRLEQEWRAMVEDTGNHSKITEMMLPVVVSSVLPRSKTTHVCKLSYSAWDCEYVHTDMTKHGHVERRYHSLSRACLVAEDGDVIEVHEGTWNEAITLIRDVTVVGMGASPELVVLRSPDCATPTLTIHSVKGLVRNVLIRQNGGDAAVLVRGGSGEVTACVLSAMRTACCVEVCRNANPWIHDNKIVECAVRVGAVLVHEGGRGLIEGNTISKCTAAGVVIEGSGTHPTVRNNRIVANKGSGVVVGLGASGIVDGCLIEANGCVGVLLETRCNPCIVGNKIIKNLGGGVSISNDGTLGLIDRNHITDNGERECWIQDGATPQLRKNTFTGASGANFGVVMSLSSKCLLLENEFIDFDMFAVVVMKRSCATLVGNTFKMHPTPQRRSGALSVTDDGRAQLRYNSFFIVGKYAVDAQQDFDDMGVINTTKKKIPVVGNKVNQKAVMPALMSEALLVPFKFDELYGTGEE